MVKQLAAIKLRSMWNMLCAQTWILVVSLLAYLYGLFVVGAIGFALVVFKYSSDDSLASELMIAFGAAFTVGWIILPLLFSSQEGTVDPPKLAPFLAPTRRLALSLLVITGVGMAGVYYLMVVVFEIVGWASTGIVPAVVAALGSALGVAISFTWSRAASAWAGRRQSSRSGRDKTGLIGFVVLMVLVAPMGFWLPMVMERYGADTWTLILGYLKWTPFGAPWGLPAAVAEADWVQLAILAAISVVTVAVGWKVWLAQLAPSMHGARTKLTDEADAAIAERRSLIDPTIDKVDTDAVGATPRYLPGADQWMRLGASGPTAAIAERTRLYWLRDPRLASQLIATLVLVLMGILMSKVMGSQMTEDGVPAVVSTGTGLFMIVLAAFVLGQVVGTLLQFDSTALWVQISAGVRGWNDRAGRFLGTLLISTIVLIASGVLFGILVAYSASQIAYLLCVMVLLFCCSAAGTTLVGSQWIYPVQAPGSSPMSTKGSGQMFTTMFVGILQFAVATVLAVIPSAVLAWAFLVESPWLPAAAALSLLWSVVVTVFGIWLGGRIYDRNQVELLTKIASWPGHGVTA